MYVTNNSSILQYCRGMSIEASLLPHNRASLIPVGERVVVTPPPPPFATYFQEKGGGECNNEDPTPTIIIISINM